MVLFSRGRFIRKPFAGKGIVQPFQQLSQAADGAACFTVAEGERPRFAEKQFTRRLTAESDAAELDGLAAAVFDDLEKTRMEGADIAEDIVPGLADELAQAIWAEKGTVPFRREAEMPAVRSFGDMLADGPA